MSTQSCEGMRQSVYQLYKKAFPALNEALVQPRIQSAFFLALIELHMLADEAEKETNTFRRRRLVKKFLHKKTTLEGFLCRARSESLCRVERPVTMHQGVTPQR